MALQGSIVWVAERESSRIAWYRWLSDQMIRRRFGRDESDQLEFVDVNCTEENRGFDTSDDAEDEDMDELVQAIDTLEESIDVIDPLYISTASSNDVSSESQSADFLDDRVTIGISSCRRLNYFMITAGALQEALKQNHVSDSLIKEVTLLLIAYEYHGLIRDLNQVIVVDDASSLKDRFVMMTSFPTFTFLMKSNRTRGHANSMNILFRHVRTRY